MGYRYPWSTHGGPGPRHKITPRPNLPYTSAKNLVDQVHRPRLPNNSSRVPNTTQTTARRSCSAGYYYKSTALEFTDQFFRPGATEFDNLGGGFVGVVGEVEELGVGNGGIGIIVCLKTDDTAISAQNFTSMTSRHFSGGGIRPGREPCRIGISRNSEDGRSQCRQRGGLHLRRSANGSRR